MRTYLPLEYAHETDLPDGHETEVRTPEALVERFLLQYTEPGDRVLDVFAGYGTTLTVAERIDRIPYGLEYEPDRVDVIEQRVDSPDRVRSGSVLDLDPSWFPTCECCFTSPPFTTANTERNPFENYAGEGTYEGYLDDIETAFGNLDAVLAPDATVVVDVVNMRHQGEVTTLAWDVADRLSELFHFEGEVVVTWEGEGSPDDREGQFGYGYDHSYCLVFSTAGE